MNGKGKILIVDDNEDVLLSLNMMLRPHVESVRVLKGPERIDEFMDSFSPDVIILDMNFHRDAVSGEEGYEWLAHILKRDPQAVVLFITAFVDTDKAVRAIKAGAVDFIPKPWDREKLINIVESALELSRSRKSQSKAVKEPEPAAMQDVALENAMVGESPAMMQLMEQIRMVAPTDANVLITGENGSGKDVVAHIIHQMSRRCGREFVSIDLGSIPEHLFESELFGHEKGAFTDAKSAKEGRIEKADGGTLFLDEIGNLTPMMQQKLLTVIEKRQLQRIGSTKGRGVDVRLLSATNANLQQRVADGTFRQDLLYRINTIELHLPPLRQRGNDIVLLAEHFLSLLAREYGRDKLTLSPEARQRLLSHTWPGNVRELRHAIERAVVMTTGNVLQPESLQLDNTVPVATERKETLNLAELERQAIMKAISLNNGNLSQAAECLGISRYTLYRKIDKLTAE